MGLALAALKMCPLRRPLRPRCDFLGAIMRPSDNGLDCHVETPVLSLTHAVTLRLNREPQNLKIKVNSSVLCPSS